MPLRLATQAMGTRFEIVLPRETPNLRSAGAEALLEIEEWDARLSRFRRDSWLSHLNRTASRGWVRLDAELLPLFELCERVHADSSGAFDPTIAPVMDALAAGGEPRALESARERVGWQRVELDSRRAALRFREPGVALDLGGIAKGFALDRATERLRELGVACALLHGGTSTTVAIGHPPGADAWRVALADPTAGAAAGGHVVACLRDRALAVSAQHGRSFLYQEQSVGHVVDPGHSPEREAAPEIAAVVAPSAAAADAWSTALLLRGDLATTPAGSCTALACSARGRRRQWRLAGGPPAFETPALVG